MIYLHALLLRSKIARYLIFVQTRDRMDSDVWRTKHYSKGEYTHRLQQCFTSYGRPQKYKPRNYNLMLLIIMKTNINEYENGTRNVIIYLIINDLKRPLNTK